MITDNKPLKKILGSKSGIPTLAANRMQRWAMIFAGYRYELIVKPDLKCADMLSRLPLKNGTGDKVLCINLVEPLSDLDIERETIKDPVLSKVMGYTKKRDGQIILARKLGNRILQNGICCH